MLVGEYMKKNVIATRPGDSLQDARKLMKTSRIRHLPVLSEEEELIGILSDRDIRKFQPTPVSVLGQQEDEEFMKTKKVEEAMTRRPVSVPPDTPLEDAATLMREEKIGCLPVVENNKMVGIISESDIFNAFTDVIRILKKKGININDYR